MRYPFSSPYLPVVLAIIKKIRRVLCVPKGIQTITHKDHERRDVVTDVDLRVEKIIMNAIQRAFPTHRILSEEAGLLRGRARDPLWIIDPIDGTTNFVRGIPWHATSIALVDNGQVIFSAIDCAPLNETMVSVLGKGSYILKQQQWHRLHVSTVPTLSRAVCAIEYYAKSLPTRTQGLQMFSRFGQRALKMRYFGSAVLGLFNIAAGQIDVFTMDGYPYDIAAGRLIVAEAGGCVTDWRGRKLPVTFDGRMQYIATNGLLHTEATAITSSF